jgi:hypothetical protein
MAIRAGPDAGSLTKNRPKRVQLLGCTTGIRACSFPLLEEITQRDVTYKNNREDPNWSKFLEAWGVTSHALAQYIGSHALTRMMLRQGFIRNFTNHMARELNLRLVERQAAVMLSESAGIAPLAKYHEIIAMSELMEGMLSAGDFQVIRNIVTKGRDTDEGQIISISRGSKIAEILKRQLPDKALEKNSIQVSHLKGNRSQFLFSTPFAGGDDTSLFDGAFYVRSGNSHHLLLIDVTKMKKNSLDEHNCKKLRDLKKACYREGGIRIEFEVGESFWDVARLLMKMINEVEIGFEGALWQIDIQYGEKEQASQKGKNSIGGSLLLVQSIAFYVSGVRLAEENENDQEVDAIGGLKDYLDDEKVKIKYKIYI